VRQRIPAFSRELKLRACLKHHHRRRPYTLHAGSSQGNRPDKSKGELLMKSRLEKLGFALLTLVLASTLTTFVFAAGGKTFTGTVSDAMCGAKHAMAGDDAGCTRECVAKGSKYALVVGDKVYTLDTSDKTALATLDKQAGAKVTVTGTEKDNMITVSSVKAAM